MKIIIPLFLACTFILSACKDKQTNERYRTVKGNIIRQIFDNNNKLLSEQQVIKTDLGYIPNGTYVDYYPSGKIQHIKFYEYGKCVGNYYKFYESGILDSVLTPCKPKPCFTSFNQNGTPSNNTALIKFLYIDTMSLHRYVPVVLQIGLFNGVNAFAMSTLADDSGHVFWTDTLNRDCESGFCVMARPVSSAIIEKPGRYTCSTVVSYIDKMTNLTLIKDTLTIHLLALNGYHGEGNAIEHSVQK